MLADAGACAPAGSGCAFPQLRPQLPQAAEDLLLRVLPDRAGVEQDHVRFQGLCRARIPPLCKDAQQYLCSSKACVERLRQASPERPLVVEPDPHDAVGASHHALPVSLVFIWQPARQ